MAPAQGRHAQHGVFCPRQTGRSDGCREVSGAAPGGGSRHQARSLLEAEASLLEDPPDARLSKRQP